MRTDGVQLSAAAVESIRATAQTAFGADAVPAAVRTYKYAQTAPVSPVFYVDVTVCREQLYTFHWRPVESMICLGSFLSTSQGA